MSADLDVRAWAYCNVGPVVSGSLEESSIVGAGLINVSGSVLLDGVFNVREGQVIELSYYKNGRMARLGRKLRAISSYANPVTRTTEVRVGCLLTYQANSEPPPQTLYSADDTDPAALELTGIAKLLLIKPTRAKYVAEKCCAALGISHAPIPLTNTFYREDFKISGPYLRVLSDLLLSENYVGYMDTTETLRFINLNVPNSSGPVLDENRIIDINPINVGDPDADTVYSIVNHKKIKLDESLKDGGSGETIEEILERNEIPDTEEVRDVIDGTASEESEGNITRTYGYTSSYWLKGYTNDGTDTRYFRYVPNKQPGQTENPPAQTGSITYQKYSKWEASYTGGGTLKFRREVTNGPWGETITETTYETYKDGGDEITKETSYTYMPNALIVEACQFPKEAVTPLPKDILAATTPGTTLVEKVIVKKVASETNVITTEERSAANIFTTDGAANIQQFIYSYTDQYRGAELEGKIPVGAILEYARAFVFDTTRFNYSEKAPQQSIVSSVGTPSSTGTLPAGTTSVDFNSLTEEEQDDLVNRELEASLSGDPSSVLEADNSGDLSDAPDDATSKNGATYSVVEVPEILYTKNTSGGIILEFTPPYLPDDQVVASGDGYAVIPSDAADKAKAFADRQNALRFGYRNGQSVVFPVEYVPIAPFSPVYLKFGSVIGQYRTDRLSIAFDNTGILVSTDAIFWGGVGK